MEENDSTKPVFDFFDFQPKTCSFSIIGIGGGAGRIVEKCRNMNCRIRIYTCLV